MHIENGGVCWVLKTASTIRAAVTLKKKLNLRQDKKTCPRAFFHSMDMIGLI